MQSKPSYLMTQILSAYTVIIRKIRNDFDDHRQVTDEFTLHLNHTNKVRRLGVCPHQQTSEIHCEVGSEELSNTWITQPFAWKDTETA